MEIVMTREAFDSRITELVSAIDAWPLDDSLEEFLNSHYGPHSEWFDNVKTLCRQAVADGWMCDRQAGGIGYGRVIRADDAAGRFSVDVVSMNDCKGPYHVHPEGEIDMIMPVEGDARFDGHGAGWLVYGAGSAHFPTVTGGHALVLYLLPSGKIEFTSPA
jgi:hypothetical protein